MTFTSIGDLAQSLLSRRENARLSSELQRLTGELASGQKSDLRMSRSGGYGSLSTFEATLSRLDAFKTAVAEAALRAGTAQSVLGLISEDAERVANTLLLSETQGQPTLVDSAAEGATRAFEAAVSALNSRAGGATVFAGQATDGLALAAADTILDAVSLAASGATAAADLEAAVDAWFAPGGDFDAVAYLGSTDPQVPARIGVHAEAAPPPLANDDAVRDVLAGLALAALLDRGALAGLPEERAAVAQRAGERLQSDGDQLTDLRASVGLSEETIARAEIRNASERATAELARNALVAADPFETVAALEETRLQIETFYAVTARLSRLSLAEFLR